MSCGVGRRRGSDPVLLWLWHRLVATAPIGPLDWEPPYAAGAAQRNSKKTKKKRNELLTWAVGTFNHGLQFEWRPLGVELHNVSEYI